MQHRRHEKPIPRVNPSGRKVWVARWTDHRGNRHIAGTFKIQGPCKAPADRGDCCAQHAIWVAYEKDNPRVSERRTVGGYAETWTKRHPRSERTNTSYNGRLKQVLDVELEHVALRDWPMSEMRRRHAVDLVDVLLTTQRRSALGAQGILRALSAMFEDAMLDDLADFNPWRKVRVRASDPRVTKAPRKVRVFSGAEMLRFCAAAAMVRTGRDAPAPVDEWRAVYAEAMLRVLSDCGLRLGELLPLRRSDVKLKACDEAGCPTLGPAGEGGVPHLHVRFTAHDGAILSGTKTDHGKADAGRVVPLTVELEALLRALPARIDTAFVFPTPRGALWRERNFYRDVWYPAQKRSGIDPTPHEFRHSWISQMRAIGVDPADLADAAGHTVQTATARYTHALRRSYDAMRKAAGS